MVASGISGLVAIRGAATGSPTGRGPVEPSAVGPAAREARTAALDSWLADLFGHAAGSGLALVALGGLGRRECGPYSDVDLLLLSDARFYDGPSHDAPRPVAGHDADGDGARDAAGRDEVGRDEAGRDEVASIAERIWYPVWDAGVALDHSVRTLDEALAVAAADPKAGLGLLDARHVCGDAGLTARLRESALAQWRRRARAHLPVLRAMTSRRWRQHGELAFLLDGDLKEARGGLRDVRVLRGIAYAHVADAWRPPIRAAYARLLDVRDCLHLVAGRRRERLFAQDLGEVAALLGAADPDGVRRRVADDARSIAYAVDDALRAAERWQAVQRRGGARNAPAARVPVAPDVVAQDGEVVLARAAVAPAVDPTLSVRVAAAAARHGLRMSPGTLEWLARHCPPLPRPWPDAARSAFAQLLGSGPAVVPIWEACDRFGLITAWLPEWSRIRSAPQHNPVHRYTVDRHLIECVATVARYARDVTRPDLLVLAALLHDIGKGLPGDHAVAGVDVAVAIARAIGLPPADADAVGRLVRLHLVLPDVATRRDLADPETVRHVAELVGDVPTLELLHALTRADAIATGPAAWSAWKERLIADLTDRVRGALITGAIPPPPAADVGHRVLAAGPLPAMEIAADRVAVAAADRPGLLASVAGCLTLHRLDVVSADTATESTPEGSVAVVACRVQPRDASGLDRRRLAADLSRAISGELRVDEALAARVRSRAPFGGLAGHAPAPARVMWAVDAATDATILELRAADDVGLLYRVAHALELAGANLRAARISTLGSDVVDAFYLLGDWSDAAAREAVERAVLAAAIPA